MLTMSQRQSNLPLPLSQVCVPFPPSLSSLLRLTISCASCVDLVQCGEVVQPVERRTRSLVKASYQQVALVGRLQATTNKHMNNKGT